MSDWYPGGAEWDECKPEETPSFEEVYGWVPDSDYEVRKCNKTPEEIEEYYRNFIDELKKEFKKATLTPKK